MKMQIRKMLSGIPRRSNLADPRNARECANHINEACPSTVHAVQGEFYVVAEPTAFTKATACQHLYSTFTGPVSFIFAAGNDRTDEDVFRWVNKLEDAKEIKSAITVSVGVRRTEAKNYVTGPQAIISALRVFASRSRVAVHCSC
jgi:trehalose-6-phosphatase